MTTPNINPTRDANRDPISGMPGAHPVGVGLGAIGAGAAVGAAGGAVAGPVGALTGAAISAVAGGFAGKATAEAINPTIERKYWSENYAQRPYSHSEYGYEEFEPAYRYGWESFGKRGREASSFESVEAELGRGWDQTKGHSRLAWDQAKQATRDAWNRVHHSSQSGTNTQQRRDA